MKESNLQHHVTAGKHKLMPEKITIRDYALLTYRNHLEGVRIESMPDIIKEAFSEIDVTDDQDQANVLERGWALPQTRNVAMLSTSLITSKTGSTIISIKVQKHKRNRTQKSWNS
jgi:hypothetical protein